MSTSLLAVLLVGAAFTSTVSCQGEGFRFANYYGDHMVLQRAPARANIWGVVDNCDAVVITFNSSFIVATIIKGPTPNDTCHWQVFLPPVEAVTPFDIIATSLSKQSIQLSDVLFGDVWVCSGQSNMQFTLPMVFNASTEAALADKYPDIRLFTAAEMTSDTPEEELLAVEQPWAVANSKSVANGNWTYFSAVCWLYGRNIYDHVKYPIGLIATDWGGTPVEAWSSPDALAKCNITKDENAPSPGEHSVLWNAMIHPFLNLTIKGAIWYQGEANAGAPDTYNCTFPAMIDDWREKWYKFNKENDETFPFGFVQLAAFGTDNSSIFQPGYPVIRWAQTANYGFAPNPRQKKVFMAVAMDLGDPTSPFGSVHPRDKQDVGARLALAGRAIAYDDALVYFSGPIAYQATYDPTTSMVTVEYLSLSGTGLELRYPYGYELGCSNSTYSEWMDATAMQVNSNKVMVGVGTCSTGLTPFSLRYCWRTDPCTFKMCPVYSDQLPSPPFMLPLS